MLVLSRREGEKIVFPSIGVTLEVLRVKGSATRLGIKAPKDIPILRDEVAQRPEAAVAAAAQGAAPGRTGSGNGSILASLPSATRHAIRNQLNAANLALHLYHRQMERGMIAEAEQTFQKILNEFESLEKLFVAKKQKKAAPVPPERRCRALVVEDDANESELLAGFLRMSGFDVATAGDGADALGYLSSHGCPDFMLLDMIMPRCDGPSTLDAIRRKPELGQMKVFAISGRSPTSFDVPMGPQGVDRWFRKPVNPEVLVQEISHQLKQEPAAT
jgi:carbon storage regulator CsrA